MRGTMKSLLVLSTALVMIVPLVGLPTSADAASGWTAPVELGGQASFDNGPATPGQIAVAPDGSAMSVWSQQIDSSGNYVVEYAMYDPATGWGPVRLLSSFFGDADSPAVTALPNGSFYMAYASEGITVAVVGGMWTPGKGWTYLEVISSAGGASDVYDIHLGADGTGNIHALWISYDGTERNVTANRYTPSSGWGTPSVIETHSTIPFGSHLAVDDGGSAIAVWVQDDGVRQRAFANRYAAGSGWGGSGTAIDHDVGLVNQVDVAVADDGEAVAVFAEVEGAAYRISSNVFTPGTGWGGAEYLSVNPGTSTNQATRPSIDASPGGQFAAVWHMGAPLYEDLHAATYTAAGGWSSVHNITANENYATQERVAVTSSGEALVTYMAFPEGSMSDVLARSTTWDAAGGWSPSETVDSFGSTWVAIDCPASTAHCAAQVQVTHGTFSSSGVSFYEGAPGSGLFLTLTSPTDGSTTQEAAVLVSGTTKPGSTVSVAGIGAVVTATGDFAVQVALVAGENEITVASTDGSGFAAVETVTVTYDDPVTELEDELAQAQADLADTQSDLADTQSDLAAAQAALADANGQIDRMKGDFTRLSNNLTATQAELDTVAASQGSSNSDVEAASGSAGTAMIVGLLGLVVGLAAIAMAVMMGRKSGAAQAAATPPPPNDEGEGKP